MLRRAPGLFIAALLVLLAGPAAAFTLRISWLPAGKMTYESFSLRSDRQSYWSTGKTYKSLLLETYWRHPLHPEFGIDFRTLQAGRILGQEMVGDYQTDPLRVDIQSWQVLAERDFAAGSNGFLAAAGGFGIVTNQFERSAHIFVNGIDVSAEVGLDPTDAHGTNRSGVRSSVENIAFPLGVRFRYLAGRRFFTEGMLTYSFLEDLTDLINGSSPFSGWATQATFFLGCRLSSSLEIHSGYLGYVNHMAAPTGQGGMRLRAPSAPDGVYVLWQENEVSLSALTVGLGYRF